MNEKKNHIELSTFSLNAGWIADAGGNTHMFNQSVYCKISENIVDLIINLPLFPVSHRIAESGDPSEGLVTFEEEL